MYTDGITTCKAGADELKTWLQEHMKGPSDDQVVTDLYTLGPWKTRALTHLTQTGLGVQYRVHCNDVQTAERGLLERVFFHWEVVDGVKVMTRPFRPTYVTVHDRLSKSRNKLLRHLVPVAPMSRSKFLSSLASSKRALYEQAADSLVERPLTQRDAHLRTFVKAEKLNISAKTDPDPRVIQPRSVRYCYALGLYIKAVEPVIYKAINRVWKSQVVMKGLNADQRGTEFATAWRAYERPVAVGLDASRWDQHVSAALLQLEHSVYLAAFHGDPHLKEMLQWQIGNIGRVYCHDGRIQYSVVGSRMSGDMNTSLGNVLLMCLLVHSYLASINLTAHLLNDGDDCVLIFEQTELHKLESLPAWFSELGIVMKVEPPVYTLDEIEFCQAHPIEITPGNWRMVRDPRVVLDKDNCVVKPVNGQFDFDYYRNAIANCGMALAGDVPVFYEFYQMLARGTKLSMRLINKLTNRDLETGMDYLAKGMSFKLSEPHTVCRVSFARAFGIWPDEQIALESVYRTITPRWDIKLQVHDVGTVYQYPESGKL